MILSFTQEKGSQLVSVSTKFKEGHTLSKQWKEMEELLVAFFLVLVDSCSSARKWGYSLVPPNIAWSLKNWVSSFLVHHFQRWWLWLWFDFPEGWGERPLLWVWLTWEGCFVPLFSTGLLEEKSQDECSQPPRLVNLATARPVERWGLVHLLFGVSAHGALPTAIHGRLLSQAQWDSDGHGASLAFARLPLGGLMEEASPRNLRSSAGWTWCPSGPRRFTPGQVWSR